MDGIQGFVVEQLVQSGIDILLKMTNPVGGVIKILETVYDFIMFIRDNWERIFKFAQTVYDTVADIAAGNIAGAAALLENALGQTIPMILDFLAKLLNFDGIVDKIQEILEKVRAPINQGIDKVLEIIIGLAQKIASGFKDKNPKDTTETANSPQGKLDNARKEALEGFKQQLYTFDTAKPFLDDIRKKYGLKKLYVEKKGGEKAKLIGEINPVFEDLIEVIRDDFADETREPLDASDEVYTLFRAMSLGELDSMRDKKQITVLVHEEDKKKRKIKKGDPKGQPFLATDAEYSKKLMKRKWEKGEKEGDEKTKKMYEYLVQIDFMPGTQDILENPDIARYERGDKASEGRFKPTGVKPRGKTSSSSERGIIVLKLEPKAETNKGDKVLNYGITPKNWEASDPLQITNAQIVKITVIAQLIE